MTPEQNGHTLTDPPDRRRRPRIAMMTPIHGHQLPLDVGITVVNISESGFFIHAPIDFPVGAEDAFQFTILGDARIVLRARVVHTAKITSEVPVMFGVGLEFVDRGNAQTDERIEHLLRFAGLMDSLQP